MAVVETETRTPPVAPPPGSPAEAELRTRSCAKCGSSLADDQECCLECGTVSRERHWYRRIVSAGWPLRTGIATIAALLVSACIGLGASVAFQGGGNVPHIVAQAPPKPVPVTPAPVVPAPAPHAAPAPAPVAPKAAPATPAPVAPKASPTHVTTTPPTTTPGSGGAGTVAPTTPSPSQQHHGGTVGQPAQNRPFPDGVQPVGASLYDPNGDGSSDHPEQTGLAVDDDPTTAWNSATYPQGLTKPGVGIWVDAGTYIAYSHLGIFTKTPGYDVEIYGSAASYPPATLPDPGWTLLAKQPSITAKQRITLNLGSLQPRYYLIWITRIPAGTHAGISEVSLIG